MRLIDFGIHDRSVQGALTLLEVLHHGHNRIRPLMPHISRRAFGKLWIVAAIGEVVAALRQGDVGGFDSRGDGIGVGIAAGAFHGIRHQPNAVIRCHPKAGNDIAKFLFILRVQLNRGVVEQAGDDANAVEGAVIAIRDGCPVLFRLEGDLVGDADGVFGRRNARVQPFAG